MGDKFWTVIRADMCWDAAQDEKVQQGIDHIYCLETPVAPDRQTFTRELVNDVQYLILPTIMLTVFNKVVRPDEVMIFGTQANAGPVVELRTSALGDFSKHIEDQRPAASNNESKPDNISP